MLSYVLFVFLVYYLHLYFALQFCRGLQWPVMNENAYIIGQSVCFTVCTLVDTYVTEMGADLKAKV